LFKIIAHVLSWMFAIGMTGCLLVIPITAYRLFSVLFEKESPRGWKGGDTVYMRIARTQTKRAGPWCACRGQVRRSGLPLSQV